MRSYSDSIAAELNPALGPIDHYNGIFFGNVTSLRADTEGALAIGGNAAFGSPGYGYDVGGAGEWNSEYTCIGEYENEAGHPSFLLGGKALEESTQARVHGGDVVLKAGYQAEYESSSFQLAGTHRYEPDKDIDAFFAVAKEQATYTSRTLHQGTVQTIAADNLANINTMDHAQYENENIKTDKRILIYTIECEPEDTVTISEIDLDDFIYDYDLIVVAAEAESIRFVSGAILFERTVIDTSLPRYYPGNKIIGEIAARLVFSFPNAKQLYAENYGIIGSIIAPYAEVTINGGSINGMLIADSLYQSGGAELHAFQMAMGSAIFDLRIDEVLGSFEIRKQNGDGTVGLEGAVFDLFEYDGEGGYEPVAQDMESDEDGRLEFENLPPGTYRLVERTPPWGYVLPQTREWTVELKIDSEGEWIPLDILYIKNALALGGATFIKQDEADHEIKLGGAVFSLYVWDDKADQYELVSTGHITDSDGSLEFEDLKPGQYKLVETAAPTGYFLPENYEIEFAIELDREGQIVPFTTVEIDNQKLAQVEVVKRDSQDSQITLEGAVFDLYKYNTETDEFEVLDTDLETDSDGGLTITGLEPGVYKLKETTAPAGYYLDATNDDTLFEIEVDKEGKLVELAPIDILNEELGKIQIYKVDNDDDKIVLENAQFTLFKYDDETAEYKEYRTGLVTGADGGLLIEELEPGDYKLVETKAPNGYELPATPETLFTIELS